MPNPGTGSKSFLQMGLETVYGTSVPATSRIEIISSNIAPNPGQARDPSLNNQRSRRGHYRTGILYRGNIRVRMNYVGKGILQLLDALFGTATIGAKGAVTTGAGPYLHVFKELPEVNSLTLELGEGNMTADKCQKYVGAQITGCTFAVAAGLGDDVMMVADFSVLAKDKLDTQTPTGGPLVAPTPDPVMGWQATTVDDGVTTAGLVVRSATIEYGTPLTEDRFGLGSKLLNQPLPADFVNPHFRFREEFNNIALLQAMTAETVGSPELVFTSGAHVMTFRMAQAKLIAQPTPIEGYSVIIADADWEGYRESGNTDASAFFMSITNSDIGTAW